MKSTMVRRHTLRGTAAAAVVAVVGGFGAGVADAAPVGAHGAFAATAATATSAQLPVADRPAPGSLPRPPAGAPGRHPYHGRTAAQWCAPRRAGHRPPRRTVQRGGRRAAARHRGGGLGGEPPHGAPVRYRPTTSSLNYQVTRPVANTVTTRPGADGSVVVTNGSSSVDVVVDLVGWVAATPDAGAVGLHATRPGGSGQPDHRPPGRDQRHLRGRRRGAVPSTARAAVVNLTTVGASANGLPLLSWAAGRLRPTTSTGNTVGVLPRHPGRRRASAPGGASPWRIGGGTSHVVVDVWATSPGRPAMPVDGRLHLAAVRLVDTRTDRHAAGLRAAPGAAGDRSWRGAPRRQRRARHDHLRAGYEGHRHARGRRER